MSLPPLANDELQVLLRHYTSIAPTQPFPKPTMPASPAPSFLPENPRNLDENAKKLRELQAKLVSQGMLVKTLKKEGKPFEAELAVHLALKKEADAIEKEAEKNKPRFDVEGLQNLMTRRMFVVPAFEIHGGVAGLMDFGPPGVGLKDNVVEEWKRHFILGESMLQVECTNITPHAVLLASGHVDRFTDLLCEEMDDQGERTGEFHRADKLLEAHLEGILGAATEEKERDVLRKLINGADALSEEEMDEAIEKYKVVGPQSKRKLSKCRAFNLMFGTTVGPSGLAKAYLRPETAQGIFVNFKRLLEYNNGKMPFASAQVGTGFRNEIAPKGGLIRVREFTMAEIEHFVHPDRKQHTRFAEIENVKIQLFTAQSQMTTFEMEIISVGDAVRQKKINNETLGYFMARSQEFFLKIGVDPIRLRFRQHLPTEMAHYATDCFDAEIKLAQGWLEVAGHADRACYDLEQHAKATRIDLKASERLETPRIEKFTQLQPVKKLVGSTFKQNAGAVVAYMEGLNEEQAVAVDETLTKYGKAEIPINGANSTVTREMATLVRGEKKIFEDRYTPSVIEPSFGIGRIVYSVLEHAYWIRGGEEEKEVVAAGAAAKTTTGAEPRDLTVFVRNVLALKPLIAPIKCGIIPYGATFDVEGARKLSQQLNQVAVTNNTDASSAFIGRKYARFDEVGVPFVVTLDDQTVENGSVTIRERDSEEQIRLQVSQVVDVIKSLCVGERMWETAKREFQIELRPGQKN